MLDWGGELSFCRDVDITNVKGWHIHFHWTNDHKVLAAGTCRVVDSTATGNSITLRSRCFDKRYDYLLVKVMVPKFGG